MRYRKVRIVLLCTLLALCFIVIIINDSRCTQPSKFKLGLNYNDSLVRAYEDEFYANDNTSQYFKKKNYFHSSKLRIISNQPWNLCKNNHGSDLDLFTSLWTLPASFELRAFIRNTYGNRTLFPNSNIGFILGLSTNSTVNSMIGEEN
jgi:hypothetical protein